MGFVAKLSIIVLVCAWIGGCALVGDATLDSELADIEKSNQEMRELSNKLKAHYDQGEKFYSEGDFAAAEAEFNAMLDLKSEEEHALYKLGAIAYKKAEFAASANYFERAIAANPRNPKAHYNLASIRLMQAENHFKYYAALADRKADLEKISDLLGHIDEFAHYGNSEAADATLDKIAGAIKK